MCIQSGLIKLKGNLDGICFYEANGKHLARMANGPSKERIETDPAYVRTKENMQEFGGASTVGKAFRIMFGEVVQRMASSYFNASLNQRFKQILNHGAGVRGKRAVQILPNKKLLKGLEFNAHSSFGSIFTAPLYTSLNVERNALQLQCTIEPTVHIRKPSGASHCRLVLAMATLSDYIYDGTAQKYTPEYPTANGLRAVVYGTVCPLLDSMDVVSLTATFANTPIIDTAVAVVVCVGVEFFQEVNGVLYGLRQANAMWVEEVL